MRDLDSIPESGRFPVEGHGNRQRSLADSSPWGRKESDTTEQLTLHINIWGIRVTSTRRDKIQDKGMNGNNRLTPVDH